MTKIEKMYGLEPVSLEEELSLPYEKKRTRLNKIDIIDQCGFAENLLKTIKNRAKNAPELDDKKHADLMEDLKNAMHRVYVAVEAAWMVGRS